MDRLESLLQERYVARVAHDTRSIGVEIELAISSHDGRVFATQDAQALASYLEAAGFVAYHFDLDKKPISFRDRANNKISYETCWHSLEFSLAPAPSITSLKNKFDELYVLASKKLSELGFSLAFVPVHPQYEILDPHCLKTSNYQAKSEALYALSNSVDADYIPAITLAVQTHLDSLNLADYLRIFELAQKLSLLEPHIFMKKAALSSAFVEAHPLFAGLDKEQLALREKIWARSKVPNRGYINTSLLCEHDFLETLKNMELFLTVDHNKLAAQEPVFVKDLEASKLHDITYLRSLNPVAFSSYGTLEIRRTDLQPKERLFEPSLFYWSQTWLKPEELVFLDDYIEELKAAAEASRYDELFERLIYDEAFYLHFSDKAKALYRRLAEAGAKALEWAGFDDDETLLRQYLALRQE